METTATFNAARAVYRRLFPQLGIAGLRAERDRCQVLAERRHVDGNAYAIQANAAAAVLREQREAYH